MVAERLVLFSLDQKQRPALAREGELQSNFRDRGKLELRHRYIWYQDRGKLCARYYKNYRIQQSLHIGGVSKQVQYSPQSYRVCPEDPWPHSRGGLPVETTSQQPNQSTVKDHHDHHRDDNLEDDGSGMCTSMAT